MLLARLCDWNVQWCRRPSKRYVSEDWSCIFVSLVWGTNWTLGRGWQCGQGSMPSKLADRTEHKEKPIIIINSQYQSRRSSSTLPCHHQHHSGCAKFQARSRNTYVCEFEITLAATATVLKQIYHRIAEYWRCQNHYRVMFIKELLNGDDDYSWLSPIYWGLLSSSRSIDV